MRDDLLRYYDDELSYLRQSGEQFREKYPKIAGRLGLQPNLCNDPHVERLLEGFAFLAARVHLKIDDEFPEITESLLSIVYPHLIRPIPSMSIVQFTLDPDKGKLTTGLPVKRGAILYSRPVDGIPCKFQTCYDATLWPLSIVSGEWKTPDRMVPPIRTGDAAGLVRLELRSPNDVPFSAFKMDRLRFHLTGEGALVNTLYELLCCNLTGILVRDLTPGSKAEPLRLEPSALRPVGFAEDEGMLPYDRRSFAGYRLLQEYFTFPDKFFFVDVTGLQGLAGKGFSNRIELIFLLSKFEGEQRRQKLEAGIRETTFRIGCVPIVNLYPQTADPIRLDQYKYEYRVEPDKQRPYGAEIFSIDEVASLRTDHKIVRFQPFYSFRHGGEGEKLQTLWIANRRPSTRAGDEGTEIDLALVDLALDPSHPPVDTLTVRTTCTNRDLPSRLPFGNETSDFELQSAAPIKSIAALLRPTPPIRPPIGKAIQWRLISHLSLNYLSLVEGGTEALRQILKLYNFTDSRSAEKIVGGITSVTSAPHFARVSSENGIAFARGTRVEIEVDEDQFVGGGAYLFLSALEHFLGSYSSLNSFSQLTAVSRQRKEGIRKWPPRAGRRILM